MDWRRWSANSIAIHRTGLKPQSRKTTPCLAFHCLYLSSYQIPVCVPTDSCEILENVLCGLGLPCTRLPRDYNRLILLIPHHGLICPVCSPKNVWRKGSFLCMTIAVVLGDEALAVNGEIFKGVDHTEDRSDKSLCIWHSITANILEISPCYFRKQYYCYFT